jgi:predicted metal-binding protein
LNASQVFPSPALLRKSVVRGALLQFGDLYLSSSTGDIPWKQFPEKLQTVSIAKIPAVGG